LRIDFEDSPSHEVLKSKLNEYYSLLPDFNTVILSDYGKGGLGHVADMIQIARAMGKTILVDPKGDDWSKYAGAHIITPNLAELRQIIGNWTSEEELAAKTQALRLHLGLDAILLTRSQDGMSLFNHRGVVHEPTRAKEIFDVSGAGDTVIATLGVFLAMGADDSYAMKIANIAAGIVVGKLGTAGVSAAEINAAFKDQEADFQFTPTNEDEFFTMIDCRRAAGDRIVMTNGCFDILHPGHVAYLEQARALGDRLIVAVNDDESVKRLKGAERPINTLAVRMQMLSALKSVDGVIAFSEDTPERIIAQVKPDILVKGGDYQIEDIVGAQFVLDNGGEVKVLSFLDGHSTSKIIERVRGT
jgi:D-beta-D-heptose 7-phosphate kinase/D-beta-D-heptose 1-phosphate adenosyltransferase